MHFYFNQGFDDWVPGDNNYPYAILNRDNWDDFGYRTSFFVKLFLSETESIDLGTVKILRNDQNIGGYTLLPSNRFARLGSKYCSLGINIDYYEKLISTDRRLATDFLDRLSDVCVSNQRLARFKDLEGFNVSLLRFSSSEKLIERVKKFIENAELRKLKRTKTRGFVLQFQTRIASDPEPFTVKFDFKRRGLLPNRINVLIGYNGSGKTSLLSNLAIAISGYGYTDKESLLEKRAGKFLGIAPALKGPLVISYSALDTFEIPGQDAQEQEHQTIYGSLFGYVYCGLREHIEGPADEPPRYRLKSPEELNSEFNNCVEGVATLPEKEKRTFHKILKSLRLETSFAKTSVSNALGEFDLGAIKEVFPILSSGHKIALKILFELTLLLDRSAPSIVLIDEPETHLHPPLLAALLKSIRAVLEKYDAYAIIATHSPVVLQETPARYVNVIRRYDDKCFAASPEIETFGENIGIITQEVFNLDDTSTDWHETLAEIVNKRPEFTAEEIDGKYFDEALGFGPRSYLESLIDDNQDGEIK